MAESFWIDIGLLKHEMLKTNFNSSNIYLTLDIDVTKRELTSLKRILNEMRSNHLEIIKAGELKDFNHKYYLPLLVNYLAIIEKDKINFLLSDLFKNLKPAKRKATVKFLQTYTRAAFSQFVQNIPNLKLKKNIINEFIESYDDKAEYGNSEKKFFKLESQKIKRVITYLVKNNIIEKASESRIIDIFNNQYDEKIRIKTTKNAFVDLLSRLAKENIVEKGDKKEFTRKVHHLFLFKSKGKYTALDFNQFYKLLTDNSRAPMKRILPTF